MNTLLEHASRPAVAGADLCEAYGNTIVLNGVDLRIGGGEAAGAGRVPPRHPVTE